MRERTKENLSELDARSQQVRSVNAEKARSARIVRAAYSSISLGLAVVALTLQLAPEFLGVQAMHAEPIARAFAILAVANLGMLFAWESMKRS